MPKPQPWWRTDEYDGAVALPEIFNAVAGPRGVALVKAYAGGKTTAGWGDETFMANYTKDAFAAQRALYGYGKGKHAFAIVMRSVRLVCLDIDGKNGGLEHAKKLGALPPTRAETSKSGDGYHLFYLVDDEWDDKLGFGRLHDRIGVEQGVDVRATGCVYHYDTQRWNGRGVAKLPQHLEDLLVSRQQERAHRAGYITKVRETGDETEILLMHAQLETDLAKPIPAGKRNNTLFAIGQQMKEAGLDGWEDKILARALQVGLTDEESEKLVTNITRYQ